MLQLAQTFTHPAPLAQLLVLGHADEVDVVLSAQCLNQLLVVWLVAVLGQQAQLCLALLNGPEGKQRDEITL